MGQSFNLVGRTTHEVELKFTQGGMAIASFTVAIDRYNSKKLKEEGKQATDFFNCVSFGKQAEYLGNHLKKGKLVEVQGEVNIDVLKGDDGKNRYFTKVVCSKVNVLEYEKKGEASPMSGGGSDEFAYDQNDFAAMDNESDVPF